MPVLSPVTRNELLLAIGCASPCTDFGRFDDSSLTVRQPVQSNPTTFGAGVGAGAAGRLESGLAVLTEGAGAGLAATGAGGSPGMAAGLASGCVRHQANPPMTAPIATSMATVIQTPRVAGLAGRFAITGAATACGSAPILEPCGDSAPTL